MIATRRHQKMAEISRNRNSLMQSSEGNVRQNPRKKYFVRKTYAMVASTGGFGLKNRNVGGIFLDQEVGKPFL
jgi:hypothetical protein